MRTDELHGTELDKWVAQAEGYILVFDSNFWLLRDPDGDFVSALNNYQPSRQWCLAGPIIEREGIETGRLADGSYYATKGRERFFYAASQPLATMRCHVWSKFGEKINDENNSNNIAKRRIG